MGTTRPTAAPAKLKNPASTSQPMSKLRWRERTRPQGRGRHLGQIINLQDPSSWPADLAAYLEGHLDLFLAWETQSQDEPSVSGRSFDRAIDGLQDVLKNYSLIGWHCTRLTEDEIAAIVARGMAPPDTRMLTARIDALVKAGSLAPDIAAKLRGKNQAHETNRAGRIWFCFFPPHIAGESGIERFFRSWGGEALYNFHEDDPQTGPILAGIGIPCLIEVEVPIASLPDAAGLALKIYPRFLVSRGHRSKRPLDHEDRAIRGLPRENIRSIIRFPEPDFIRLTKCDEWRAPLPQT